MAKRSHTWHIISPQNNDTVCDVWENYEVVLKHHKPRQASKIYHNAESDKFM